MRPCVGAFDDREVTRDYKRRLATAGAWFSSVCEAAAGAPRGWLYSRAIRIRAGAVGIPLLHIADPKAAAIAGAGIASVGLLGTRFTMEQDFYTGRLRERHGLQVLVPPPADRELVHRVIYEELCRGEALDRSRANYRRVIAELAARGAQGVILGCTEISLLVTQQDSAVPLFDTTLLHASGAAEWALGPTWV